ncbi:DUF2194 domain-containing protein [Aquimarina agarilytica]|uniref:DUF2194 domain-containing protein n=1 Tax=Aquimarina agarilytica TaxID=1087449 RepID=UPI0002892843|nr:DUF2194 domain-containing protein [Aquimarina agarilytica]
MINSCQKIIEETYIDEKEVSLVEKIPQIQFINDHEIAESISYVKHFQKICDYTKFSFLETSIQDWNKKHFIPSSVKVLIVRDTRNIKTRTINTIVEFVSNGGSLVLLSNIEDKRFAYFMGLKPDASLVIDNTATGIHFQKAVLPNLKGNKSALKTIHFGLARNNFVKDINVLATSVSNTEFPVLLEHKIDNGNVILYNSTNALTKRDRGLLFSMIIKGLEGRPYPIVNVSTIFIDDFPSPLYDSENEPIKSEMGISNRDFVTKVWWQDMLALSKEFNIDYTALVAFEYSDNTLPPFAFEQWDLNSQKGDVLGSNWMAEEVLNQGHELGLHGYNHVSLLLNDWKNANYMGMSLVAAKKKWKISQLGKLPVSYVPPSNYIDSVGLNKLVKIIPSIKYMCSLYLGNYAEGNEREYDTDKLNKHLFDYPRISSGYVIENEKDYDIHSLYLYTGIWSHFVHPDDVYQIKSEKNTSRGHFEYRNKHNLFWRKSINDKEGMFTTFRNYLKEFQGVYPLNRYLNAENASVSVQKWRKAHYFYREEGDKYIVEKLEIKDAAREHFWFMYVSDANSYKMDLSLTKEGIEFYKTEYLDGYLYSLKTNKKSITVFDLESSEKSKVNTSTKEYTAFYKRRAEILAIDYMIQEYIQEDNLEAAILNLENRMKSNPIIRPEVWNAYIKLNSWEEIEIDIWDLLDKHFIKYPYPENLIYAKELSYVIGYKNVAASKKWLGREIKLFPNAVEPIKKYIKTFSSEKNKEEIIGLLEKLITLEPNKENHEQYIQHLLWYMPTKITSKLNKIKPCVVGTIDKSSDIAWIYAQNKNYKKALNWADCDDEITEETRIDWIIKAKDFKLLKRKNYARYIQYLLNNDPVTLEEELSEITICKKEELTNLTDEITWFYAGKKDYSKALEWAKCSDQIEIDSILYWYYELKDYHGLKEAYKSYIEKHPDDYKIKIVMVNYLHAMGEFKSSWVLANSLPNNDGKEIPRKMLNNDVLYEERNLQKELIRDYSALFYPETKKELIKRIRIAEGNILTVNSNIETNNDVISFFSKRAGYTFYDKKKNNHSIFATHTNIYKIEIPFDSSDNIDRNLVGAQYEYYNKAKFKKYRYKLRGGAELDKSANLFYNLGGTLHTVNIKNFFGAELDIYPVRTGPGYSKNIYRSQLNLYKEHYLKSRFQNIVSLEINYYTDNEIQGVVVNRTTLLPLNKEMKHTFYPFIEGAFSKASVDRGAGYPYWTIDQRLNGGFGLAYKLGKEKSRFKLRVDGTLFIDDFSGLFTRFTGKTSYDLTDYTILTSNFEIFNDDDFFSNVFQVGLKYYFPYK